MRRPSMPDAPSLLLDAASDLAFFAGGGVVGFPEACVACSVSASTVAWADNGSIIPASAAIFCATVLP